MLLNAQIGLKGSPRKGEDLFFITYLSFVQGDQKRMSYIQE